MLRRIHGQWAAQSCVWASYWAEGGAGAAQPRLSLAIVEQLLYVADSQQRILAALLADVPAGQPGGGGGFGAAGEAGQSDTFHVLRRASTNLLGLASKCNSIPVGLTRDAFPWEPWCRCLAHLTQLLRRMGWEEHLPAERQQGAQPPPAPAAEADWNLQQQAWVAWGTWRGHCWTRFQSKRSLSRRQRRLWWWRQLLSWHA